MPLNRGVIIKTEPRQTIKNSYKKKNACKGCLKILLQTFFYFLKNDANQNKRCLSVAQQIAELSIFKKSRNYFFSDFSILAFNAANTSLLSPKVAAAAFVDVEADEVFSVAVFTFFSSSSRKIAV